jgi:hypothetical protein
MLSSTDHLCTNRGGACADEHVHPVVGRLISCAEVREGESNVDRLSTTLHDAIPLSTRLEADGMGARRRADHLTEGG